MASTLTAIKSSATPLNIDAEGYLVLTTVARDSQDRVTVTEQRASGGQPARSRIAPGGVGSTPALPATAELLPQRNQTMYVAEVYYRFQLVTPVGRLLGLVPTSTLYDAAVF